MRQMLSSAVFMHKFAAGIFFALVFLAAGASRAAQPLIFLGDKDLRPYEFIENGRPRGANVDLAMAIGRELGRPVEVRLMDWNAAQQRLLAGEGHALTLLARTPERESHYAFTQPTMPAAFALFVRAEDNHRFIGQSLAGKTIGVTHGGLARSHLQKTHPEATYFTVDTLLDGVQRLARREIDAMAAQEWSAYYLLNEIGIRGIVGLDPFLRLNSNMAVRKADAALATALDSGLERVKASGEFDRILDRWSHTRVHLVSGRMATAVGLIAVTVAFILVLLTFTVLWQRRQRMTMAREVKHRRQLEQDLRRSRTTLEETDRIKDQFLATLAHELRNPLAPILHAVRVIELRGGESPELVHARGVIDRQTRHLSQLVDDLLDVGRIKTGKLKLRRQAYELWPIVQEALEACEHLIAAGGHQVRCDVPQLWIDCDRLRIAQVLGNLLTNAAKYNPQPVQIGVRAHVQNGMVAVLVSDNGVGISPDELACVFELFHQGRQRSAGETDGLGIGLWLSRQFAELHGGTLTASSGGPGQGAEFTLRIPAAIQPRIEPTASSGGAGAPQRILIVDDNVDAAETLAMLLRMGGHDATIALTGRTAVELAAAVQPQTVFLDLGLPDIGGLQVCRMLRRSPRGAAMTIVALTGWGTAQDIERTADAGFDGHLTKPVGPDAIEQWLVVPRSGRPGMHQLRDDAHVPPADSTPA